MVPIQHKHSVNCACCDGSGFVQLPLDDDEDNCRCIVEPANACSKCQRATHWEWEDPELDRREGTISDD